MAEAVFAAQVYFDPPPELHHPFEAAWFEMGGTNETMKLKSMGRNCQIAQERHFKIKTFGDY